MKVPVTPPSTQEVLASVGPERLLDVMQAGSDGAPEGRYRHYDTLRHVSPPEGLSTDEWWLAIKLARAQRSRPLPLRSADGQAFTYALPDPALAMLHRIDRDAAGHLMAEEVVTNPSVRDRYVVRSLMEEAVTSSQLEGASTTRQAAVELLRSGRRPRDHSEWMILGNYNAMRWVREHLDKPLSPELVLELHRVLGEGSIDEHDLGRLQTPEDDRVAVLWSDGQVLYRPPPAAELRERLAVMCDFFNGDARPDGFLPPVVKAILLHFWLAHDHPFADGNGRTARALFYWAMLKQGYWVAEFLSISNIIREAPAQYARSFLYVETDDNDLTYFALAQLRTICRALEEFRRYVDRKISEVREAEMAMRRDLDLNHRQRALVAHALRHPGFSYTYRSHSRSNDVTHESARLDLSDLAERGLLRANRSKRPHTYTPAPDLAERLREG